MILMEKENSGKTSKSVDLEQDKKSSEAKIVQLVIPSFHLPNLRSLFKLSRFVGMVLVIAVLFIIWLLVKPSNPLPANIRSQVHFTAFVPKNLPADFGPPKNYSFAKNVLTIEVDKNGTQRIFINEQTQPANFDVNHFNQDEIKDTQIFNTKYGQAYFGNLEQSQIGSLLNSGVWIFLSEVKSVGNPNDLVTVMKSLQQY
jgi:hypothetical protein